MALSLHHELNIDQLARWTKAELLAALSQLGYNTGKLRRYNKEELLSVAAAHVDRMRKTHEAEEQRRAEQHAKELAADLENDSSNAVRTGMVAAVLTEIANCEKVLVAFQEKIRDTNDIGYELRWHAADVYYRNALLRELHDLHGFLAEEENAETCTKTVAEILDELKKEQQRVVDRVLSSDPLSCGMSSGDSSLGQFKAYQYMARFLRSLHYHATEELNDQRGRLRYICVM